VHEANARKATVVRLQRENRRLRARRADITKPGTLEREARKRGMVRPGEKAYVVTGLPKGD
jgi:cell division protein FtsB